MKEALQKKIDLKTKPIGALGKLEQIALKIGLAQNTLNPELKNPTMLVFAGDHGLTEEGVSPYPKEVSFQMVMNFLQGGAAINVFCRQNDINLKVVDAGVDFEFPKDSKLIHAKMGHGTKNMMKEPAMSLELCRETMDKGAELVNEEFKNGCNIIGFGEMGIGNTSSASLLMHKYTGKSIQECTGRGTGHDDAGLIKKTEILEKVAGLYDSNDPMEILATFGGFENTMMAGAMLQAARNNMIIMVDGFIATSALLAAYHQDNSILDYCVFTHVSDESGHKLMLEYLNVEAVVGLDMRLGEGTGAAVCYPIIKSAIAFLKEMASFEDAGVANKD